MRVPTTVGGKMLSSFLRGLFPETGQFVRQIADIEQEAHARGVAEERARLLDPVVIEKAAHRVIWRWWELSMLRFGTHDDGSDDLLLSAEIRRAILAAMAPSSPPDDRGGPEGDGTA